MSVIKIENLWKEYRLGVIGHGTLTHDLQSWWARVRGKEDPNARITSLMSGQEKQIDGDHFWALRDINLEVKQGEVLGIIGSNGAGKSTLLKILSRVTSPSRGSFKIKGRIVSLLEVGTGFHPELTGRENIFLNGAILGMSKGEIKRKVDEIIDFSGIEDFVETPVKRYSSGMYVRLAFAVAAHLEPEILIIDEVLAVGDASFQKRCLGKMQDISSQGRTILFVSHNMSAVSRLCTRCVLLGNGEVIQEGQTSDIVLSYYESIAEKTSNQQQNIGDEYCRMEEAWLLDQNGKETNEVQLHEEIKISMIYTILQETSDRCVPNFHLKTIEGNYVCCVNSPDIKPLKPGRYKVVCLIPPYLLNEGAYSVDLAITSYPDNDQPHHINFWVKEMLRFNVIDPKVPDNWNYGYLGGLPGVIRPRLSWEIIEV